jgi:hypothetical protein
MLDFAHMQRPQRAAWHRKINLFRAASVLTLLLLGCTSAAGFDGAGGAAPKEDASSAQPTDSGAEDAEAEPPLVECTNEHRCPRPAICVLGKCKTDVKDCRASAIRCANERPACAEGMIVSVEDNCWADCVDPSLCYALDDCATCAANAACIEVLGPFESNFVCGEGARACDPLTCECSPGICGGDLVCVRASGNTVTCGAGDTGGGGAAGGGAAGTMAFP